ncbi:MAG: DUF6141 family protein [Armatimonadetes bacterium]|nr:DUF6141 family protein [Armatimonadota bacterium]
MIKKSLHSDVIYREVQQFRQTWLWIALFPFSLLLASLFGYGMIKQLVLGVPWGDRPMSDTELAISGPLTLLIAIGVPFLLYITKLITVVDPEGIQIRYFPLLRRTIPFENLKNYRVRTYDAISEHWGWGIRWNKNGWAYTVSGNRGVELELADGRRLLIGSQQPEILVQAIETAIKQQQNQKGKVER